MKALMEYLPENYEHSAETTTFQRAIQPELDMIWQARDSLLAQLNPYTATWGLTLWEDALGLTGVLTDLELRRGRVAAKLRGMRTTTVQAIKDIVKAATGREGEVVEYYDRYAFEVIVLWLSTDVNVSCQELARLIEEVKPAHLTLTLTSALQTEGGVQVGAVTERSVDLDVWPMLVNELESAGGIKIAGPLEYYTTVEIYPYEEDENV